MERKPVEILAPAGSFESMKAAVAAGADAVYIGGSRFGARAYAENPGEDELLEAIDYVHFHGRKLYLTVNTLMKDAEMKELYAYLLPYYKQGLDAVIVQDLGVFSLVKSCFPDLAIHASTQMTITGVYGARMMKELGAERVVTARELSLGEIRRIHDEVDIEIESFVHGALCYCYSGQCLFSSLIGGRSGNRGRCAQPCRLPYDVRQDGKTLNRGDQRYVLSLKDLSTLDLIPDLIEAGVYSMKIEGRMKSPRYTAGVTAVYRKYADLYMDHGRAGYRVEESDRKLLLDLFDRGGQTDGYYKQHNGRGMVVWKEKPAFKEGNQELFAMLDREYVEKQVKEPVTGTVSLAEGQETQLTLECGGRSVCVSGAAPQKALNQPMDEEKVRRQMEKTGNTPFAFEKLDVKLTGDLFLPVQALNELRRTGFQALEEEILGGFRRKEIPDLSGRQGFPEVSCREDVSEASCREKVGTSSHRAEGCTEKDRFPKTITVSLESPDSFQATLSFPEVSRIYIDAAAWKPEEWKQTASDCRQAGKTCYLMMPHIFRTEAEDFFDRNLGLLKLAGFDGVLIRSLEEQGYLTAKGIDLPAIYDSCVYGMNGQAQEMLLKEGADSLTWPVELNMRELKGLPYKGELIAYGRLPMMVTAQCLHKSLKACDKKTEVTVLKDRIGKEFPVKNHCRFCYNTIYNAAPVSLLGLEKDMEGLNPRSLRLSFTTETAEETRLVIKGFAAGWIHGKEAGLPFTEFTRGHFKRGVE